MNTIVITGKYTKKIRNSKGNTAKNQLGGHWEDIGQKAAESRRDPKRSPRTSAGQTPKTTTPL